MSLVNPISINIPEAMDNSTKFTRSIAVNLVAGVSSVLAPVNDNRTGAVLRNPGAYDVYLCLADVATAASAIAVIEPNGFYELAPADYNGAISVICPAGAGSIAGSEMSSTAFAAIGPTALAAGYSAFLQNDALKVNKPDGTIVTLEEGGVVQAYALNGAAYTIDGDNNYWFYQVPDLLKQASNVGNWAAVVASGTRI